MSTEPNRGPGEFLCYEVVRQMEARGAEISETAFNKLCALVYEEVDSDEVDLPLRWYQYGYEVYREPLADDFLQEVQRSDWERLGTQVTLEGTDITFDLPDDLKEDIKTAASLFADKFYRSNSTEIKDYSYEQQAPNEFVRVMNEFRDKLDDLDAEGTANRDEHVPGVDISFTDATEVEAESTDIEASDVDDEEIEEYLRRLSRSFPEDRYSEMEPLFYQWKTLCKQLIRHDLYGELRQFQSSFWNTFSRAELRIHHSENITPGQRRRWIEEREEHIERFKEEMAAKRKVIQNHREPTDRLSSVSAAYDEAVEKINKRTEQ